MKINKNVDLESSFDRLKEGLAKSEQLWKDEQSVPLAADRLRKAYANLFAVVSVELDYVEKGKIAPPVTYRQSQTLTTP